MSHWAVFFTGEGKLKSAERIAGKLQDGSAGFVVEADDQEEAVRLARPLWMAYSREYARKKTAERRKRFDAEGRCRCGRPRNVQDPKRPGEVMRTCDVCQERSKSTLERYRSRGTKTDSEVAAKGQALRLEHSAQRTRNRRAELRLETLLEVRAMAEKLKPGEFRVWLHREVQRCVAAGVKGAA